MAEGLLVQPIRKERLSQRIALEICRMISAGQVRSGDQLPAERELAGQLAVSRASLREALRGLEIAGIVETKHGGGTVVRRFSAFGIESPLAMIFEASHDNVSDLWEVRRIIEPSLAERAAVRADDEGVAWLGNMLERHRVPYLSEGDGDQPRSLDREFHRGVARLTGNDALEQVIQLVNTLVHRGYRMNPELAVERRRVAYKRHVAIFEAIRDRDPQQARQCMVDHLQEIEEYILTELIDQHNEDESTGTYVEEDER